MFFSSGIYTVVNPNPNQHKSVLNSKNGYSFLSLAIEVCNDSIGWRWFIFEK